MSKEEKWEELYEEYKAGSMLTIEELEGKWESQDQEYKKRLSEISDSSSEQYKQTKGEWKKLKTEFENEKKKIEKYKGIAKNEDKIEKAKKERDAYKSLLDELLDARKENEAIIERRQVLVKKAEKLGEELKELKYNEEHLKIALKSPNLAPEDRERISKRLSDNITKQNENQHSFSENYIALQKELKVSIRPISEDEIEELKQGVDKFNKICELLVEGKTMGEITSVLLKEKNDKDNRNIDELQKDDKDERNVDELQKEKDDKDEKNAEKLENITTNNSHEEKSGEYEMMLEMYNQDLETLYDLQKQYESGILEYSEYEKHADYMVERYSFIMSEHTKAKELYNEQRKAENKYIDFNNNDLKEELEKLEEQLKSSGKRLEALKGYDEQYADERATYSKIVQTISDIKKEFETREKNPLRAISTEQLKIDKAELEKQLELSGKRLEALKGYDEQYADERATYSKIVKKLSAINKELDNELRKTIEKPEQPMMILEKEKPEIGKPEPSKPEPSKPEPSKPEPGKSEPGKGKENPVQGKKTENKEQNEYEMMLEMYNQDLETLYDLQKQYESGILEYSEYEKHADYMVERYRFIMSEYNKAMELYNEQRKAENKYIDLNDEDLKDKLEKLEEQLGLSGKRLDDLKGYDEQYADERTTYNKIVQEISDIKKEFEAREKNPLRTISTEQLEIDKAELEKQLELSGKRLEALKGYDEQYADERATYSKIVEKLSAINKELDNELRKTIEKPEQPMMILEKEGQIPPPPPGGEKKPKTNLPIRSFWEIYNDTCTEHASNFAVKMHNFAHMKLLPSKDEESLTKILSIPLLAIKVPIKLGAMIPNKIMGTDKKYREMQENISELSQQDFDILVSNSDEVNKTYGEGTKATYDSDYLEPQFMKQFKVNELYLKAVASRYVTEREDKIKQNNIQISRLEEKINRLSEIRKTRELTVDEVTTYNGLTRSIKEYKDIGIEARREKDTFTDGIKKRSSAFKNIRGWFLASFNPDNREENSKMAELSKERREAEETGDINQIYIKINEMSNFAKDQTKLFGVKNDKIDRGSYSIESPVESLDKGEENRGRLIASNVAIAVSIADFVNQIQNNINIQNTINAHNANIQQANAANSNIPVSGEIDISQIEGAKEAQEALARQTAEATFNRTERGDFCANNWDINSPGYIAADAINHAESAKVMQMVQNEIANGNAQKALETATQFFIKNSGKNEQEMQNLLNTGYSYDYSAINWGAAADAQTILNFFTGKAKFNQVVSGTMVSTLQNIKSGVSPLAAIFAGANAIYEAARTKNQFKKVLRESARESRDNENNEEIQQNLQGNVQENIQEENTER